MSNTDIAFRLERIERSLARLGVLDDLVNPVDPSPVDTGRIRPELLELRLVDLLRDFRIPKGDPPPDDIVRRRWSDFAASVNDIARRWRNPVVDPPPDEFFNVRVLDLLRRWRGGFSDPAPDDLAGVRLRDLFERLPGGVGGVGDPAPEDIGRLSKAELESQLHKLSAEVVRLNSMQRMIKERLEAQGEEERPPDA
jgi:hypothetical protein